MIIEMRHMLCACTCIRPCTYVIVMTYVHVVIYMCPFIDTYFLYQIYIISFHLSIIFNDIFRFVKSRRHHNTLGRLLPITYINYIDTDYWTSDTYSSFNMDWRYVTSYIC